MKMCAHKTFVNMRQNTRVGETGTQIPNRSAFTLLELLVVIVIIGLLAAIGLPAIRGMTKSNAMAAANRQLLDDLAFARLRAIAEHTTVYMVFMPPAGAEPWETQIYNGTFYPEQLATLTNLWAGQFTTYALLCLRTVGDQPGMSTPRFLTGWRTLPAGVYISTNKFNRYVAANTDEYARAFPSGNITGLTFPFPSIPTNQASKVIRVGLPYIAFNHLGQLANPNNQNEAIPLVRGSIFPLRDATGGIQPAPVDLVETPPGNSYYDPPGTMTPPPGPTNTQYNVIYIDWLTGKAKVIQAQLQ